MDLSYHRPSTLEEAQTLLAQTPGAVFVAGGTDLFVQRQARKIQGPIISLRGIDELRGIEQKDDLMIMAGEPLTRIMQHETIQRDYPALVRSIEVLGSHQIRNVATLGGNLCNASPGADTAPPLIVYGARARIRGRPDSDGNRCRSVAITEFFAGPGETCLQPGEILEGVVLDEPGPDLRSSFIRQGRVKMDIAIASLAVAFEWDGAKATGIRIAAGAVAPVPLRLTRTEAQLEGSSLDADVLARASVTAMDEVQPIDDIRASAEYRRDLIGVFVRRAVRAALEERR